MAEALLHKLMTITVTFHPDVGAVADQLRRLPASALKVVIDNGSGDELFAELRAALSDIPGIHIIANRQNLGLASAINHAAFGIPAGDSEREYILLLDQDSLPASGAVERLMIAFDELSTTGEALGCIGPQLFDPATGLSHGFHIMSRWRWSRRHPQIQESTPILCSSLNGSGTLLSRRLFDMLHGLDDALFIDHVDTEFSFRVLSHGYRLYGIPDARFEHRMGEHSLRFWFGRWRVVPSRSPQRHFFLFRNTVLLMRRPYVPRVWKVWAMAKLALSMALFTTLDRRRFEQLSAMLKGIQHGLR